MKRIFFHLFLTFLFILCYPYANGQTVKIDSLLNAIKHSKHDTLRIGALVELSTEFYLDNPDTAIYYSKIAILQTESRLKSLSPKQPAFYAYNKLRGEALSIIGTSYSRMNDLVNAMAHLNRAQKIFSDIGNNEGIAAAYYNIGSIYLKTGEQKKALDNFLKSLELQDGISEPRGKAFCLVSVGDIYQDEGNYTKAIEYYQKSLRIMEEIGDKDGIAGSLNNMGDLYKEQGNIPKALEYLNKALKLREETGDKRGTASALINLGLIYHQNAEHLKAIEDFQRSFNLFESVRDTVGMAESMKDIGFVYANSGDPAVINSLAESQQLGRKKALEYYAKSMFFYERTGDLRGIGFLSGSMGAVYSKQGDPDKALSCYEKSLALLRKLNNRRGIAATLNRIGHLYFTKKKYPQAMANCKESLTIANEIGNPEVIMNTSRTLAEIHKALGNHKLALENYERHIQMRDSLNSESNRKASVKSQLKYEYEKQAAADSVAHAKESEIKNVQFQKQTAEIKAKKNQQYALFGGLVLVMIFAGFMFNRFKVTQKQKGIIELQKFEVEKQKHLVDEKQKEVLDSINYARRIQMALIPSEKQIERILRRLKSP